MTSKIQDIFNRIDLKIHHNLPSLKLDFIGDVHGYADELELLLRKLGYIHRNNTWQHQIYKAVFVGDFINRGPQSRKVLKIVRSMVENKSAYAILGNHEINAICYFTRRKSGLPIRIPGPANKKMLDRIKNEYKDLNDLENDIKWLRKLPLFYDFKHVRVTHAYWSQSHIELIHGSLHEGKLKRNFLRDMVKGGTALSKAFMQTTKGVEFCFPHNLIVKDNYNVRRMHYRIKWWEDPVNKTFEEISFETKFALPNTPIPSNLISNYEIYDHSAPPLFIGHYCASESNLIQTQNICCIDACVANGGKLAAYRWDGEQHLLHDKIILINKA